MAESTIEILIRARDQTRGTLRELDRTIERVGRNRGLRQVARDSDQANRSLQRVDTTAQRAGRSLNLLRLVSFAALTASVVQSTRAFLSFNNAIAEVSTLVDEAVVSSEQLTETVLDLSDAYGQDSNQVAAALYQTISSGAEAGAEANEILEVALQAAIGGVTDANTAVDAITSTLNAYNLSAEDAGDVSDSLFTAVRGGKTTFDELGRTLSNVTPLAASVGIGFDEVNAAIAAITLSGTRTSVATTQLRSALAGVLRPTAELTELFRDVGGAQQALANQGIGFVFERLQEASAGSAGALQALVGSQEAVLAINNLSGPALERFNQQLEAQADRAGAAEEAFNKVNDEISQRFTRAITNARNGAIRLVNALEPILGVIADLISEFGGFIGTLTTAEEAQSVFDDFAPILIDLRDAFILLGQTVGDTITTLLDAESGGDALKVVLEGLTDVIEILAFGVAAITDGFNVLKAVALDVASTVSGIAFAFSLIIPGAQDAQDAIAAFGQETKAASNEIFEEFKQGDTALARLTARIEEAEAAQERLANQEPLDENQVNEFADAWVPVKENVDDATVSLAVQQAQLQQAAVDAAALIEELRRLEQIEAATSAIDLENLEADFEQNLIGLQEFFDERLAIQQRALDAEIAVQQEIVNAGQIGGQVEGASAEQVAAAETQLIILRRQRAQLGVASAREEAEAQRELNEELREAEVLLGELQNGGVIPLELQEEDIRAQYADLLARLEADSNVAGVQIVNALINQQVFEARLDSIEGSFTETLTNFENQIALTDAQVDAGLISQAEGIERIANLRAEVLPQLIAERDALQEIAAATGDPAAIARLAEVQQAINGVEQATFDWGAAVEDVVVQNITSAFNSIIDGSKSAEDAFRQFAQQALVQIAQLIAQQLILNALGFGGAGGGSGGIISSLFSQGGPVMKPPGFATGGGFISGPGGPTGDRIPARLSDGEFVMRAASVKKYGVQFMAALNRGLLDMPSLALPMVDIPKPRRAFASGGLVTDSGAERRDPDDQQAGQTNLRLVNVVDTDQTANYLASSEGESMIVNVIRRNGSSIKSILR